MTPLAIQYQFDGDHRCYYIEIFKTIGGEPIMGLMIFSSLTA